MMPNSLLILTGVAFYMLIMLAIGLWASRKVHSLSDFLVAGRNLSYPFALATLFATWFGGGTCMGGSGSAYSDGLLSVVADPYAAGIALIIAGLFYVKLLRRLKLLTVTDIFGKYYGKNAEIFASLLMVPVYIGWLGSQMVALGYLINLLTGISPAIAIIVSALIVLIYTYAGGMWAVTLTDVIQVVVLIAGLLILFPKVLGEVGGLSSLIANSTEGTWDFFPKNAGASDWFSYLGDWALMGLGVVVGQDLIQRSLASKNENIAQSSAISAGILYLLIGSIPVILGIAGRKLIPGLEDAELILPRLSMEYLHPVLLVLFVGALLSAIMSSADSSLLAATSLITNNVVKPLLSAKNCHSREGANDNSGDGNNELPLLRTARFSTILITVLAMEVALYVKEIYDLMVNSWATLLVAILVPVTAALYWKRANKEAAWASMIVGTFSWIGYIQIVSGNFFETSDTIYSQGALLGGGMSLVSYIGVTLFKRLLESLHTSQQ